MATTEDRLGRVPGISEQGVAGDPRRAAGPECLAGGQGQHLAGGRRDRLAQSADGRLGAADAALGGEAMATLEERMAAYDATLSQMNERFTDVHRRLDDIRAWLMALTGLAGAQLTAMVVMAIMLARR
jgi:hypothetical protein